MRIIQFRAVFFRSGARLFDLLIVSISILDAWILSALGTSTNLNLIKLLRIIRLVRIIRVVRIVRFSKELMAATRALALSGSVLSWTFGLVLLFTFVSSLCIKLIVDLTIQDRTSVVYEKYFRSNLGTALTLFQVMTFSDSHQHIKRPLLQATAYPTISYMVINIYVVIARFGLITTATSVLVMNVNENEKQRNRQRIISNMEINRKIILDLSRVFVSSDGKILIESFLFAWKHPKVISKLRALALEHVEPTYLYSLLDSDNEGYIRVSEFPERLLKIKQGAPILAIKSISDQLARIDTTIATIERKVKSLTISPTTERLESLDTECRKILVEESNNEIVKKRISGHIKLSS